jgi:hypothetical protein
MEIASPRGGKTCHVVAHNRRISPGKHRLPQNIYVTG